MNKQWIQVLVAAVFEVLWVIGMKHAGQAWSWAGTAAAVYISFHFLIRASKVLPVGTVYSVFVGLGTAGTVLAEVVLFHEALNPAKLILLAVLLAGIIGLKLATPEGHSTKGAGFE